MGPSWNKLNKKAPGSVNFQPIIQRRNQKTSHTTTYKCVVEWCLYIYIYIADRGIFSKKKLKYLDDNKINLDWLD
jgi:hypothetical protein